jgi:large subunit ribosomal protein L4
MAKIDIVNIKNEKVGSIDLADEVFAQKVNAPLVLQVIKAQLAGLRQGTHSVKNKSEVRGGGKKPFRQKGTGNARQGTIRSPLMPGGASTFGPKPRKYNHDTPKKMVQGALKSVLSDKLASQRLVVLDDFKIANPKTKIVYDILKNNFKVDKVLIVDENNKSLNLAVRNLKNASYLNIEDINVYDMVKYEWLFLTKQSVEKISARLGAHKN